MIPFEYSAESALGNMPFPSRPRFREHCQAENLDVSATHLSLSSPGASKIRLHLPRRDSANRYSKGLDFLSRLDRTLAGKSDEPVGVIGIFTIDNIPSMPPGTVQLPLEIGSEDNYREPAPVFRCSTVWCIHCIPKFENKHRETSGHPEKSR